MPDNESPEQHDSISPDIVYTWLWWCERCLDYHYGPYECPYEDYEFCPHCGQLMRRGNPDGGWT